MESAILVQDLDFRFSKTRPVLHKVSLDVPAGSIYGFLGPNGAGKTTTMRLLTGQLDSEADNILILGQSLKHNQPKVFSKVSALIETPSFYQHLTARQNLEIICKLREINYNRIEYVLGLVDLKNTGKKLARQFSLGMKQRLALALALLSDPELLLLDEPVNGLDPSGIVEMRQLLVELNKTQGKTIFISSHLLQEVEKMCTHIGIIHHGRIEFQGSLAELRLHARSAGELRVQTLSDSATLKQLTQGWDGVSVEDSVLVFPNLQPEGIAALNKQLVEMNVPVSGIYVKGGLEEWFMQVISQNKKRAAHA